jgi:hypothetical protein
MKNCLRNRLIFTICILATLLGVSPPLGGQLQATLCETGVGLQILTDKNSYAPGATMQVSFIVTNIGEQPLYLFRHAGRCTGQFGWFSLVIWNSRNRSVETHECSADYDMEALDVVSFLRGSKSGVQLVEGEIYGKVLSYELPKERGTYRLQGQLTPASLKDDQEKELSEQKMRIPKRFCQSPAITITVK